MSNAFGVKLKQLRTERGWTLEQLSARSGLSISHISSLERGTRMKPSFQVAVRLARALEVPLATFLEDAGKEESDPLEHLPPEIREFVSREDATPYLYLAKRLQEAHVSLQEMERWLRDERSSPEHDPPPGSSDDKPRRKSTRI
ncbi:helix-turn-helix domain-containing protein [Kyrpidia tusciae]|uniref:Transcriptional regulator, XRE family n=1 Tax=Kyrpidia tusciae (strain DSM 2912 / NBRC 15312 / T2) TaxID=562970 RepID=D5WUY3_KYRT2|nr:helix-turn-helix domain-containing protein [Kyrpidia tusciae]ADG07455.1 transcriptional regulator, XRE family [Kyrpidia tusciae DSM 2912]MBE3552575.1 helix-turn-helix transcriptional regulator [Kyrpidia tusciae]